MKTKLSDNEIIKIYDNNINFLLNNSEGTVSGATKHSIKQQIVGGSIKLPDIIELNQIINIDSIDSYLEIGSYIGFSFYMFNKMLQPNRALSIDPNIKHRIFNTPRTMFTKLNQEFLQSGKASYIDGFFAGTLIQTKHPIYTSIDFKEKFDCIFIDGEHDYVSAQRDFIEASKILGDGGIIILHDIYTWPGVTKLCAELDRHFDWDIKRTDKAKCIDGFAVVKRK